jgi:hypothetical protein
MSILIGALPAITCFDRGKTTERSDDDRGVALRASASHVRPVDLFGSGLGPQESCHAS